MNRYTVLVLFVVTMLMLAMACPADEAAPAVGVSVDIAADGPMFGYVVEKPYKLIVTFTNSSKEELKLDKFSVTWKANKDFALDVKPDGDVPVSVASGNDAVANFIIKFPNIAAGQYVTLTGNVERTAGDKKIVDSSDMSITVSPTYEITLLPSRPVLDMSDEGKRVGMSVINHSDSLFDGKVTLSAYPGIHVNPAEFDSKIEPYGLEAYMFTVTADKNVAPGHYAVFVDVGGKSKDWAAVEVPVIARKAQRKVDIDGKLDDWKNAVAISIAKTITNKEGKRSSEKIGVGKFAYDASSLYVAFEIDNSKDSDSVILGFDPLMNGVKGVGGGYKEDDVEYSFAGDVVTKLRGVDDKPTAGVKNIPFAFKQDGNKGIYEIAVPWSELSITPGKDKTFALSILVNGSNGPIEWGGGMLGKKDPRKFLPVVLAE